MSLFHEGGEKPHRILGTNRENYLGNPASAFEILSACGQYPNASLCVCCVHDGAGTCSKQTTGKVSGICDEYVLAGYDPAILELCVENALHENAGSNRP